MKMQTYFSIDSVPAAEWDRLAGNHRIGLQTGHLGAIEKSGINRLIPQYYMFSDGEMRQAAAYCAQFEIDFSKMNRDIAPDVLKTLKQWNPGFLRMKLVECGIISGLGEALSVSNGDIRFGLSALAEAAEVFAKRSGTDFILYRDIPFGKYDEYAQVLKPLGYLPVMGFPAAVMDIHWKSFEEYMQALKSNTRREIRRHQVKLQGSHLSVDVLTNFGAMSDRLFALWSEVHSKADSYEHEMLNEAYFRRIDEDLGEHSFVIAIRHFGNIIAFALCLDGSEELISLYVGIDYDKNSQYDLYFNLHLLALQEAIFRNRRRINFGITSYDFKMLIGCELEPLVYFVKHITHPERSRALVHFFDKAIPKPENPHRPFISQDGGKRMQPAEIDGRIRESIERPIHDVFHKVNAYHRDQDLRLAGLYAFFPAFSSAQCKTVAYQNRRLIMLGSNSYMGLGSEPEVCKAASQAIDKYGTGCSGSPFLNGTLEIHENLRHSLADFLNKQDVLLFGTGYQTNVGVISGLAGRHDLLILDSLDHASIVDASRFSFAEVVRFRHNDMDSLETILRQNPKRGKLIVTDSVFSMEGTLINLPEVVRLSKKYGARLMLDEAHGIGVMGPGGRGVAEHFGLLDQVDIVMGTFSKSFAAVGGFVAGDADVINFIRHVSRPHMFSASLPPPVIATVQKALEIIQREPERRARVLLNAQFMAEGLQKLGFDAVFRGTPVVPVYCRDEMLTLGLFKKLFDEGVYVNPVLSPAVPKGQELLRTSYMAIHDEETLTAALRIFKRIRTTHFPGPKVSADKGIPREERVSIKMTRKSEKPSILSC